MAGLLVTSFAQSSTALEMSQNANVGAFSSVTSGSGVTDGSRALRMNIASALATWMRFHTIAANTTNTGYIAVKIALRALPSATTQILVWQNTGNSQMGYVAIDTTGALGLYTAGGVQIGSSSAALNLNQNYVVEFKNDASTTPGTLELRLNGTTVASGSNNVQGQWARFSLGCVTAGGTIDIVFGALVHRDSTSTTNNSWIGSNFKVFPFRGNAGGDSNMWLDNASAVGTTNNYTLTNSNPPSTTVFAQSNTLNDLDLYNVTDATGIVGANDTIGSVQIYTRGRNGTAADAVTAYKQVVEKASGGTKVLSPAMILNSAGFGTSPQTSNLSLDRDPDGSAWTRLTLDSMQVGAQLTAAGTNPIQMNGLWGYASYVVGAGRFVQGLGNSTISATSITITVTANTTLGNTVIIPIKGAASFVATSASDSKGNTWVVDLTNATSANTVSVVRANLTSALVIGDTITVTMSGSGGLGAQAYEYTGNLVPDVSSATGGTGVTTLTRSITTTSANDVLMTILTSNTNGAIYNPPTNFVDRVGAYNPIGVYLDLLDFTPGVTGTFTTAWSWNTSANAALALISYTPVVASSFVPRMALLGVG